MRTASELRGFAAELERREEDLAGVAFCFDVYLEFNRDGREPTAHMDAPRSRAQLDEAIARLLGLPSPWEG